MDRLVDQRQRAVLEFAGRVGIAGGVGQLLELEGALERDRVEAAAADEDGRTFVVQAVGERAQRLFHGQDPIEQRGQLAEIVGDAPHLLAELVAGAGHELEQIDQGRQLAGEGLGRGNADFGAGAGQQDRFGGVGD